AETFTEYMGKGEEVLIMGRIKQDRWKTANDENRSKIRVICENFQFLSRRRSGGDGGDGQDRNRGSEEDLNSNFDDPGAVPF
ncbi:single-stranded DNA-binding protein, partial [Planctomycetota bacterium]